MGSWLALQSQRSQQLSLQQSSESTERQSRAPEGWKPKYSEKGRTGEDDLGFGSSGLLSWLLELDRLTHPITASEWPLHARTQPSPKSLSCLQVADLKRKERGGGRSQLLLTWLAECLLVLGAVWWVWGQWRKKQWDLIPTVTVYSLEG